MSTSSADSIDPFCTDSAPAIRKPWQTPEVIVSELRETRGGIGGPTDYTATSYPNPIGS